MHSSVHNPEIWGGIECTINRVEDRFFDQLQYANHYKRDGDVEAVASLGIKKIRYPILWEKHQPFQNSVIDWTWTETQLQKFSDAGIDVIAGLVHHGSGPAFTNLLDEAFPQLLADYAAKVATRFPHLKYYTPVNEPLTTARFSGLYGLWYPHKRGDRYFAKMLLNELKGTVLAMQAIRKINPDAQLVQTEDLGKTYSTPLLRYQARFENERRWLTYDILCGKLNENHKLWKYFKKLRIPESDLQFFLDNPCPPDVFGFNHYVTSERYLDEKVNLYAPHCRGGNGRHRYADVEVVRVNIAEETGIKVLLREAWERYKKPIAITEVHLHCHREEQLRWFKYVWSAAKDLLAEGVNLQAVTAWALLGSYGWNKLLTKPKGTYEPGVFDLRGGAPRPTALATFIKKLSQADHEHPLTKEKGWWERSTRFFNHVPVLRLHGESFHRQDEKPLLIIGKTGTLGNAFAHICFDRSIPFVLLGRQDCDIADEASIEKAINFYKPWAIINTAGYVRIEDAEQERERCFRENKTGAVQLASACKRHSIRYLGFSTDQVFDGSKRNPYCETDAINPLNTYGRSKAESEQAILAANANALIIRTAAFFGPWDECNFLHYVIDNLSKQRQISVPNDIYISPTYLPDLVNASLDLLVDEEEGIRHLTNKGSISWADLSLETAKILRLNSMFINAMPVAGMQLKAPTPAYTVLGTEKGLLMPTLDNALHRFAKERKPQISTRLIV